MKYALKISKISERKHKYHTSTTYQAQLFDGDELVDVEDFFGAEANFCGLWISMHQAKGPIPFCLGATLVANGNMIQAFAELISGGCGDCVVTDQVSPLEGTVEFV